MPNNFNLNNNKESFVDEFSQTTIRGNFSNDANCVMCNGVPNTTPTSVTYTVTFNNADNAKGTDTYTAQPFESIGHAIDEKALAITNYAPVYYYNGSIVGTYTVLQIKSDITLDVVWIKLK